MVRRSLHFLLALLAWTAAGLATCPAAHAQPVLSGLEQLGGVVSDEQLSGMRGRFATPNGIAYFGIEMDTLWQAPDGNATQAKLLISLDLGAAKTAVVPQVFVSWKRDESNGALDVAANGEAGVVSAGSGQIPVGGLDTVHGAVQSQQIAGTDNLVLNSMTVAISPTETARSSPAGMTPITGNMTQTFDDGDSIQFLVGGNRLGIVMTGEGTDAVRQTVESGANQLAQHVLLNSNGNNIVSRMNLEIGLDPTAAHAGAIGVTNAMNAAGGNGF